MRTRTFAPTRRRAPGVERKGARAQRLGGARAQRRYANEVVIDAPAKITNDLLTTFNVSIVVAEDKELYEIAGEDVNAVAEARGAYHHVPCGHERLVLPVAKRIVDNRTAFKARNARETKSEEAFLLRAINAHHRNHRNSTVKWKNYTDCGTCQLHRSIITLAVRVLCVPLR